MSNELLSGIPSGFFYLKEIEPTIIQDIKATNDNLMDKGVEGYYAKECILTIQAAREFHKRIYFALKFD